MRYRNSTPVGGTAPPVVGQVQHGGVAPEEQVDVLVVLAAGAGVRHFVN